MSTSPKQPLTSEDVHAFEINKLANAETFVNPLKDSEHGEALNPCILVIFGASGDLTGRKLIPALFNLMVENQLPPNFVCVGFARREKTNEAFRKELADHIKEHSRTAPDSHDLSLFLDKIFYYQSEFHSDDGYKGLQIYLKDLDAKFGTEGNRVFYLSVQPTYFLPIIEQLKKHNLLYDIHSEKRFSRVIIEKPFGHDYQSALNLQKDLVKSLDESQIYRIDHYLGKETVQNLLVFRFSNSIFEGLWNNRYVDNIQITVAESIGVEERGVFYESAGLVRDIIQNHLMQLLTLVTMEPPTSLNPDAIRQEKVKVLESIQPYTMEDIAKFAHRGQYAKGYIEGAPVKAYREEDKVSPTSNVETFAAFRILLDNWRWSGVPIYIRSGKRLPKRSTEIVVSFKKMPNILFFKDKKEKHNVANQIIFRIQPDEGISIRFHSKVPGSAKIITPVNMDFQYASFFGHEVPEAYERLIYDCILGDNTLFARVDESLHSWTFLTPILEYWKERPLTGEEFYPAGSWGTTQSSELLKLDQRQWKPI